MSEVRVTIPNMDDYRLSLIDRRYTFWCLGHIIDVSASNYDMALRVCYKVWQSKIDSTLPRAPIKPPVFLLATSDPKFPKLPRRYYPPWSNSSNIIPLIYPLKKHAARLRAP
jgi:hypothetical protein